MVLQVGLDEGEGDSLIPLFSHAATHDRSEEQNGRRRPPLRGIKGANLYAVQGPLVTTYLPLALLYGILAYAIRFWLSFWPYNSWRSTDGDLVLPYRPNHVKPLHALLVVLAVLTPAAVLLRKVSYEFGLLQPFSVASQRPITLRELSALTQPGLKSVIVLRRFLPMAATAQVALMAASLAVVPLGAMLIHGGTWTTWDWSHEALVGIAAGHILDTQLGELEVPLWQAKSPAVGWAEKRFAGHTERTVRSNRSNQTFPSQLPPLLQDGSLHIDGAVYHDLLTIKWSASCGYVEAAAPGEQCADDKPWECVSYRHANLMPFREVQLPIISFVEDSPLAVIYDPASKTTYFRITGRSPQHPASENGLSDTAATNKEWISRVACRPSLSWHLSDWKWNAAAHHMDLVATRGGTASSQLQESLDASGLDKLEALLSIMPLDLHRTSRDDRILERALGLASSGDSRGRAPSLVDFDRLYHDLAMSLALTVSSGVYGTYYPAVYFPTSRPVYAVRERVLLALVWTMLLPVVMCIGAIWWNHLHRRVYRRADFWGLTMALRGNGWDERLLGLGLFQKASGPAGEMRNEGKARGRAVKELASEAELLETFGHKKVRFGAEKVTGRVGLVEVDQWVDLDDPDLYI